MVDRLVAGTDGNPLALLEVAQRLDDAQWLGAAALPAPLPAGDRLRSYYEATLAGLAPAAWQAVLFTALVGEAGTAASAVATVLGDRGVAADDALEEAREHGVLVREGNGYRFRHPLLRSAVLELATPSEQREAHRALAAVLPTGDRTRIWHLAAVHRRHRPRRCR